MKRARVNAKPASERPATRTSLRRKFQTALINAKKSRLQSETSLKISRTVEMVDQRTDAWRSEQSKLLFMTALGLTPVENWEGMVPFSLSAPDIFGFEELKPSSSDGATHSHTNTNQRYLDTSNSENNSTACKFIPAAVNEREDDPDDDCVFLCEIKYETTSGCSDIQIGNKIEA